MRSVNIILLLLCFQFLKAQTLSETQLRNARATGYAIVAARNPGISFSVLVIPWDGINSLEYNANTQINPGWHAQAAIKGNFFYQAFDGSDFSIYSSVITSQDEFDIYKATGTQWWIVCSTLPQFASVISSKGMNFGISNSNPLTRVHIQGEHTTTQFRLTLPASRNGNGNGEINLQAWVSEPGVTWDGGGIGINVNNANTGNLIPDGFSRLNNALGQSFIRFLPNGGAMEFNTTNNSGTTYYQSMFLKEGMLGIGTNSPSEKLTVNGNIRTKKIIVTQTGWADYVFQKGYKLRTLSEIDKYIRIHKHLPDVPTEKQISENGLNVGDTQVLLLKKIEELTLYIIELKKEIAKKQDKIMTKRNRYELKKLK